MPPLPPPGAPEWSQSRSRPRSAAAGNRKHMAMLERLSKRSSSCAAAAAPFSDSTGASPVDFLSRLAAAKLAAESALSACRSTTGDEATASLAAAAAAIDDLDRVVAEASHALPPYELRSALAAADDLLAAHRVAASELKPKQSSFRNKSRAPKNPPQDPATLPPPQSPAPEQPKPALHAILPGFGFRGKEGAALVKDLRVSNDKDGDFTARSISTQGQVPGDVRPQVEKLPSHQIRIHEARATNFYLRVRSRLIIEDCSGVRFAPHALKYEGIEEDLKDSRLAEETGNWANVDDFKWLRAVQSPNWCLVPEEERIPVVDISHVRDQEV
ncbi:hypothetical protein EJB05_53477, partial [Eragrostis curvula]